MAQDYGTPYTPLPAQPPKNNRTIIIVVVILAVLLLCCCVCVAGYYALSAGSNSIFQQVQQTLNAPSIP